MKGKLCAIVAAALFVSLLSGCGSEASGGEETLRVGLIPTNHEAVTA